MNYSASVFDDQKIVRKEMGLEWMLRPSDGRSKSPIAADNAKSLEGPNEEVSSFETYWQQECEIHLMSCQ